MIASTDLIAGVGIVDAAGVGIAAAALALGLRHGIDWDHIAAITDITSTAATDDDSDADG